ncbi:MAG: branched-chain amino acid ABC transporter permease [Termitinemataceae bacterium]|nr:MAG: branched-chain amino acid ABC transporter permease [Termitinemataceae bacterium]
MVYGIVLLINFAHGDILMVGAYAGFFVLSFFGINPYSLIFAFMFSMAVCGILGVLIERLAYKPLRAAPRLNSLITAIAVSLILQNGARVIPFIGPNPRQFPRPPVFNINLGFISFSNIQLIVIVVSALLMIALNYVVNHTKLGKSMRAVSFDAGAASLMGVSVDTTISFTFAVGSVLAAAGGILYAFSYPQIWPTMGSMPGLKAFVAAVLGGIGSIPGAMIGGIALGIAEVLAKGYLWSEYSDAITFFILIIILLVKPTGIMGVKTRIKV